LKVNVNGKAMRRVPRRVVPSIALLALTLGAHRAVSQSPSSRFWGSVGGGVGHSGPANSTGLDQYTGPTVDAAVGASLTSRGVIAIDVAAWRKTTPIGSSRSTFVTLSLLGYPFGSALDNLFFQGGLGVGNASFPTLETSQQTPSRLDVTRPALLIALGYDVPVACPIWLTPFFQSYGTVGGHRVTTGLPKGQHESDNAILFHFGISLRYSHPGPANECRRRGPAMTQ